jgi:S-adenosylmethionine:tRNA ribosyltransferase-isomerase
VKAATRPRASRQVRLLALDTSAERHSGPHTLEQLPLLLAPGDLVIVNDAATLPAALRGVLADGTEPGAPLELRLIGPAIAPGGPRWLAAVLGAGDWRTPTEKRPDPPPLRPGNRIRFDAHPGLEARVVMPSPRSPRLFEVEFDRGGAALWSALYRAGRPVQYAHMAEELELWSVQTPFAAQPWAVEMPSAGRPISMALLLSLRRHGIEVASLTHSAGLSSLGDERLDAVLPLPERYHLPTETNELYARCRQRGGRVIAVGTTVVRALETALNDGKLRVGSGISELVVDGEVGPVRAVDGLLTGLHAPGESHFRLLRAFASRALLDAAWQRAEELGYLNHEFGDLALLAPGISSSQTQRGGEQWILGPDQMNWEKVPPPAPLPGGVMK